MRGRRGPFGPLMPLMAPGPTADSYASLSDGILGPPEPQGARSVD